MTAETREAANDLRAVLSELFPLRNYENVEFDPVTLGALVLIRRQLELKKYHVPKQLPPGYAEGAAPGPTAKAKGRQKEPCE
ncbi:MAG: hypothetical protein K8U57_27615 [Planctomycetes bacterium]|nr:hypothetical protein [Planctomycetota bacterium]